MNLPLGTMTKWGVAALAALFVVAQFIPVDYTNPPVQSDVQAPAQVKSILVKACFDCHSHETKWPWYSKIAPVSWWVLGHVRDGRKDLNFSIWPTYNFASQDLIMREISKQVAGERMPLRSYTVGHPEARLTAEERQVLLDWARAGFADDSEYFP